MRLIEIVGSIVAAAMLPACSTDPSAAEPLARIIDPTSESRAELKRIVSRALNGLDVMLADDALTQSSLLIIEPKTYRDAQGNPINGRLLDVPVQFVLRKQGEHCVLESRSSGGRWELAETKCVTE